VKTYQALLIFANTLPEPEVQETLQLVRGEVEKAGGSVAGTDPILKRSFARPLSKMESGQYARMVVQLPPAAVNGLQARLKLNEKIFRTQIVELPKPAKPATAAAAGGKSDGQSE
jgi:ribosomal protein S6